MKKMCVCVRFFPSVAFTNLLALQFFLLICHRCALRGQSGVVVRTVRQALWDFKAFASTKIPAKIEARAAREGYPRPMNIFHIRFKSHFQHGEMQNII